MASDTTVPHDDNAPGTRVADGALPDGCRMLVVGDSHSKFWSGHDGVAVPDRIPEVTTYSVGPALAYNLSRSGTTTSGSERATRFLDAVAAHGRMPDFLMLSFGEIDLRAHVVRRAIRSGIPLAAAVEAIVANYLTFIAAVRRYGARVLVWGPPAAQGDGYSFNPTRPVTGSELERNAATRHFHALLAAAADEHGFTFLSILEPLLLPGNLTNRIFYYDGAHLGQVAMPLALDALERATGFRPAWTPLGNAATVYDTIFQPPRLINVGTTASWRLLPRTANQDGAPLAADPAARRPVVAPPGPAELLLDLRTLRPLDRIEFIHPTVAAAAASSDRLLMSADTRTFEPATAVKVVGARRIFRLGGRELRSFRLIHAGDAGTLAIEGVEMIGPGFLPVPGPG